MFAVLPAWHRYVPASPGLTDDTTILVCDSPASLSDSSETPRLKSAETSLPPPQSEAGAGLTFATALLGSGPEASCSSPQPLSCASSRELST